MFACVLILIFLLPVALLPPILENLISSNELDEMGIRLEPSQPRDSVQVI